MSKAAVFVIEDPQGQSFQSLWFAVGSLYLCCLHNISNTISGLNVKNLSLELSMVSEWYALGFQLGLSLFQLNQIKQHFPRDIDCCITEVVDLWLRSTPWASWRDIITALRRMGDLTAAERIESKYVRRARGMTIQQ